jgi:hypothetical protein
MVEEVSECDRCTGLRASVMLMRELGVTKWGDIELGPAPGPTQEPEAQATQHEHVSPEEAERRARDARRRVGLAAASGIRERIGVER